MAKHLNQEERLAKLELLLKIVDEGVTMEDFVDSFQNIVDMVKKIQEMNNEERDSITDLFKSLSERTSGEIDALTSEIKSKLGAVRSGKDGLPGQDGVDGTDGERGNKITLVKSKKDLPNSAKIGDVYILEDSQELYIYE